MDSWVRKPASPARLDRNDASWVAAQWGTHGARRRCHAGRQGARPATGGLRWLAATGPYDPETVLCRDQDDTPSSPSWQPMTDGDLAPDDDIRISIPTGMSPPRRSRWRTGTGGAVLRHLRGLTARSGDVRWCPNRDRERYPRTDPAVTFHPGRPGPVVAWAPDGVGDREGVGPGGFVGPGSPWSRRSGEVREAAIELGSCVIGSQPHPYPRSLMPYQRKR